MTAAAVMTVVLVAACGSGAGSATSGGGPPAGSGGAQVPAAFPVTISDCGRTLSFSSPPRRVVILNAAVADALVELGVGDRIVGQSGTSFAPPLPQNKDVMARVPTLSPGRLTSTEALLGATPDLVISDLAYRLDQGSGGASLPQLEAAGAKVYISAGGCTNSAGEGKVADVFTDIDNLGKIFGVPDKAKDLTSRLQSQLTDVSQRVASLPKVPVFEFILIGGMFYTVGGVERDSLAPSGGVTIFPDLNSQNQVVSKEQISARNPQAIIEVTYGQPLDVDALKQAFPTTDAVRNGRIYLLNDATAAGSAGTIRVVDGIRARAMMLHPEAF